MWLLNLLDSMRKVLLIQEVISNYRVPVYNLIAKECDLTLLYSKGKVPNDIDFSVIRHDSFHMGPFKFFKLGFSKILKEYDIIIFLFNPMEISILLRIVFNKVIKKRKFIPWGIGVPASYNVKYDDPSKKINLFFTKLFIKLSDAVIFYSDYPVKKYSEMGIDNSKLFVAHNTVAVDQSGHNRALQNNRECYLFVGSLYKQKGIEVLLDAYNKAYAQENNLLPLVIIGGGDEYESINKWIHDNHLENKIIMKGAVYDEGELASFFCQARACVSPNQAGLSVQKSFGYGVPFITRIDAITGGEIFDIVNGKTGLLYNEDSDLVDILLDINSNPLRYSEMGSNCILFYKEHRTIEIMAKGVTDAIDYVIN